MRFCVAPHCYPCACIPAQLIACKYTPPPTTMQPHSHVCVKPLLPRYIKCCVKYMQYAKSRTLGCVRLSLLRRPRFQSTCRYFHCGRYRLMYPLIHLIPSAAVSPSWQTTPPRLQVDLYRCGRRRSGTDHHTRHSVRDHSTHDSKCRDGPCA